MQRVFVHQNFFSRGPILMVRDIKRNMLLDEASVTQLFDRLKCNRLHMSMSQVPIDLIPD